MIKKEFSSLAPTFQKEIMCEELNLNGIIVCDDIFTKLKDYESDKMYDSIASYETLEYLKKQNLIKYELIYKRLSAKYNCLENSRKFIAIVKKIDI